MWLPRGSTCCRPGLPLGRLPQAQLCPRGGRQQLDLGPYAAQVKAATLAFGGITMKTKLFGAAAALCLCAVAANASTIGPNDFGPSAIVQTFNQLPVEGGANQSSFLLDGTTYSFSPGSFDITSTGCISGNCIENTVANAEWNIALSTPAFSVGGYLGSAGQLAGFNAQGTAVTFYDATGTTILGVINPVGIDPNSNTGFFGFQSDGALISFIRIDPNGSQSSVWLDNFTIETTPPSAAPLPAALPLFATGLGAMGLLGWWRKRKTAALKGGHR